MAGLRFEVRQPVSKPMFQTSVWNRQPVSKPMHHVASRNIVQNCLHVPKQLGLPNWLPNGWIDTCYTFRGGSSGFVTGKIYGRDENWLELTFKIFLDLANQSGKRPHNNNNKKNQREKNKYKVYYLWNNIGGYIGQDVSRKIKFCS